MWSKSNLSEGMVVRSADGVRLGRVYALGDDEFQVEKGVFFKRDHLATYLDVRSVINGEIVLNRRLEELPEVDPLTAERLGLERLIPQDPGSLRIRDEVLGGVGLHAGGPLTVPSVPGSTEHAWRAYERHEEPQRERVERDEEDDDPRTHREPSENKEPTRH